MKQDPQHISALMALAIAIGGGVASALLLIIAFKGTALAMTLTYLAPLPIMIAGLSLGSLAGLIGAISGTLAVVVAGLIYGEQIGVGSMLIPALTGAFGFAVTIGFPSWWLTKQTLQTSALSDEDSALDPHFTPVGALLVWTAILVAAPVVLTLIVASIHFGSYDQAVSAVAGKIEPLLRDSLERSGAQLPPNFEVKDWADWTPRAMPSLAAGSAVIMMAANLWLAGRVAEMSQRLRRPWPDLRDALHLPRSLAVAFAAAVVVAFGGGLLGASALVVAVSIGAAFALLGLAVAHALLRNSPSRSAMLFGFYLVMALFFPFPLILLVPLGLAETLMSLRARRAASSTN